MKKVILILVLFMGASGCKVNPFTGQKTLNFYPNCKRLVYAWW